MSHRRLIVSAVCLTILMLPVAQVCAGMLEMSEDCPMMTQGPPSPPPCHQGAGQVVEGSERPTPDCCWVSEARATQDSSRVLISRTLLSQAATAVPAESAAASRVGVAGSSPEAPPPRQRRAELSVYRL